MSHTAKPSAIAQTDIIICPDCDLLFPKPMLHTGERAICPRCGAELLERKGHSLDPTLALAFTSFILFIMANFNTLLTMEIGGRSQSEAIISGVGELYDQGFWEVAVLVFVVSILAPLTKILCLGYVLVPLRLNTRLPPYAIPVFRCFESLHPWAMTEVYMLGILVATVKLTDMADIELGIALYSFVALIVSMAATDASLDAHAIWERLENAI
jgi:paraquat-inducible protein A